MLFLSQIINKPIRDRQGTELARVLDVVIRMPSSEKTCPTLHGLVARTGRSGPGFFVPRHRLGNLRPDGITLATPEIALEMFERRPGELLLAKDVWDRRVIDPLTRNVRRVNDVALGRADDRDDPMRLPDGSYPLAELSALGVDIGIDGIVRRLGLRRILGGMLGARLAPVILPWEDVDLLTGGPNEAASRHENLAGMHPVEIAAITEQVSNSEAARLLSGLDDEMAADVMEELTAERQLDILEYMADARAADIIEEMAPDDASDLLGDLSEERASSIIGQMEPDAVAPMRTLLSYPDNTAGGMMTTSFVRIEDHATVSDAIAALRRDVEKPDMIYYVYVVDTLTANHLVGVVTLRDLLLADPEAKIGDIMQIRLVYTFPAEDDQEVAHKMAKYNLMALPVLDEEGAIMGIVTVDDALDVLLPSGWQRRLPRIFH